MELNEDYQNIDSFNPKRTRKGKIHPEELKPDYGDQATKSARGRLFLPIIYTILSFSILLSLLTLLTAIILIRQISSEVEKSETVLRIEFAEWKNNVTGNYEEMGIALTGHQAEISRLRQYLPPCSWGWISFSQHCYYFSSRKGIWTDAQSSCASTDAHLVVINNADEQAFVRSKLSDSHWIGLSDASNENAWRWVDGTNYYSSVTFWRAREPNGRSSENCVEMTSGGDWNDLSCFVSINWVCEKPAQ